MSRILTLVIILASTLSAQLPKPGGSGGGGGGSGDVTQAGNNAMTGQNTYTLTPSVGALPFRVGPAKASYEATFIQPAFDESGTIVGMLNHATLIAAFRAINQNNSANNFGVGLSGIAASNHGAGSLTLRNGFEGITYNLGAGTLTTGAGGMAWAEARAGVITTAIGFRAMSNVASGGTITNSIGIQVEAQTAGGTLNRAIRTLGTAPSEFGGQIMAPAAGVEFTESDTNPTCAAGNFTLSADLSENKLKACQNGTLSDLLNTVVGGAGIIVTPSASAYTVEADTAALSLVYLPLTGGTMTGKITGGLTATTAGYRLTAGTLPSAQVAGDLFMNASGIPGWSDGTNASAAVGHLGSGAAYSTAPTAGRMATWAANYKLLEASATEMSVPLFCADAGASDTYACNLDKAPASYVTGTHYRFKANTANTGAATINFNSLGAKTIVKVAGGITTALADNDIRAGQWVDLVYDGTNMQMQSTLGNAASGGANTALSNLASVAINTALLPDANGTIDLGSTAPLYFRNLFIGGIAMAGAPAAASSEFLFGNADTNRIRMTAGYLALGSAIKLYWSSGNPSADAFDAGIQRTGAGVLEINNGTAIGTTPGNARDIIGRQIRYAERTADPSASDLTIAGSNAKDVMAIYMKNDKFVIAYNASGTVTYISIPLDGSTATWTHSTSAP